MRTGYNIVKLRDKIGKITFLFKLPIYMKNADPKATHLTLDDTRHVCHAYFIIYANLCSMVSVKVNISIMPNQYKENMQQQV